MSGKNNNEINNLKAQIEKLQKENDELRMYKDKTQLARNYNIVKEENEKLRVKADADATIKMIEKLNDEFAVVFDKNLEMEEDLKNISAELQKYKDEEHSFNDDIRGGNIKLSINEYWILEWLNEAYLNSDEGTYKWNIEKYKTEENAEKMFCYRLCGVIWSYFNKMTNEDEALTNLILNELNNGDEIEEVDYSSEEDE